jgi:hypothetical protein
MDLGAEDLVVEVLVADRGVLEVRKHARHGTGTFRATGTDACNRLRPFPYHRAMPLGSLSMMAASSALAAPSALADDTADASAPEARAMLVAGGIAQVTGLAISPLLVLSAIGWHDRLMLTDGTSIPLHASLWLLIPCTLVLGLLLGKKFASPATPLPLRKMLDAAEYFEAKLSALVAAGVLLPTIITTMSAATGAAPPPEQAASILGSVATIAWTTPLVLIVYATVWVTFHAVDALVVLSPFAIVDAALVSARAAILGVIAAAFAIHPFAAFLICVPLVALSILVAGWCVRLDLFAMGIASDLLLRRWRRTDAGDGPLRAFLASDAHGAPVRTMGHAHPSEDGLRFTYRPLFIMPRRTLAIDAPRTVLVRGVVWSNLHDPEAARDILALPPRYQPHHEVVAARFEAETRDGRVRRGIRGLRELLSSVLRGTAARADPA